MLVVYLPTLNHRLYISFVKYLSLFRMAQTGFPAPKDANEVEKVMRECHKEILHVFQLQPMDTADTLLSKHLITEELYGKLLSVPDSDTNKARQMVLNVKMKIKNNPQDFIYFLEVLRNNDAARSLVTKLEKSGKIMSYVHQMNYWLVRPFQIKY